MTSALPTLFPGYCIFLPPGAIEQDRTGKMRDPGNKVAVLDCKVAKIKNFTHAQGTGVSIRAGHRG